MTLRKNLRDFRRWLRRSKNSTWVLVFLFLLLGLSWWLVLRPAHVTEPRPVMCWLCAHSEIREVVEERIDRYRCTRCGGRVGFVWKCYTCHFEFPLVLRKFAPGEKTKAEELAYRLREWRCPNCRRSDCYQMGNVQFEKRRHLPKPPATPP